MAMSRNKLWVVGCGPGGPEYVIPAAANAVAKARTVLGTERLLALFPESIARQVPLPAAVEPAIETIDEYLQDGSVTVLVSGDPGLFSLGKSIVAHFGEDHVAIIAAVSSLQVAFARLGLDWADTRIISAHGRTPQASAQELSRSDKVAIFAGARRATEWVRRTVDELAATHAVFACENLTLPDESVREVLSEEICSAEFSSLTLLVLVRRNEHSKERVISDFMGG